MEISNEIREKYVQVVDGRDFITYEGLRRLAHDRIQSIHIVPVTITTDADRLVVVHASISDTNGNVWEALGDASKETCVPEVAAHYVRIAEIRAKGRAMRDMLGLEMLMLEELFPRTNGPAASGSLSGANGAPITQDQVYRIQQLMQSRNIAREEALSLLQKALNKSSLRDLSAAEADVFIENLLRYSKAS